MILSCLGELARCQAMWETRLQPSDGRPPETSQTSSRLRSLRGILGGIDTKRDGTEFLREPASIVEDVIPMGTPATVGKDQWSAYRGVVAGRLVNCYSKNDMVRRLLVDPDETCVSRRFLCPSHVTIVDPRSHVPREEPGVLAPESTRGNKPNRAVGR